MPPRVKKRDVDLITQPLTWPRNVERTPANKRAKAPYRTSTQRQKIDALKRILKTMDVKSAILCWAVRTPRDLLDPTFPEPGVSLWYEWRDEKRCVAVDAWHTASANLSAVIRTVNGQYFTLTSRAHSETDAERSATPAPIEPPSKAHFDPRKHQAQILELDKDDLDSEVIVRTQVNHLRLKYHPDTGMLRDDGASFRVINEAFESLKTAWKQRKQEEAELAEVASADDDDDDETEAHIWRRPERDVGDDIEAETESETERAWASDP